MGHKHKDGHPRTKPMPGEEYPSHLVGMWEYIETYTAKNHFPPTRTEIAAAGYAPSTSVVNYYLRIMQERYNMVTVTPYISRGITCTDREDWTTEQYEKE